MLCQKDIDGFDLKNDDDIWSPQPDIIRYPRVKTLISGDKQKLSPHFDELKSPFVEDRLDGTSPHSCPS